MTSKDQIKTYDGTPVDLAEVDARIAARAGDAMQRIAILLGIRGRAVGSTGHQQPGNSSHTSGRQRG